MRFVPQIDHMCILYTNSMLCKFDTLLVFILIGRNVKDQVAGFNKVKHKSFGSRRDAKAFLRVMLLPSLRLVTK